MHNPTKVLVPPVPGTERRNEILNDFHSGRMPRIDAALRADLIGGIRELRNQTGLTLEDCKTECEIRLVGIKRDDSVQQELEFWKGLAIYLADCHAGTAYYDGLLKSCSKSRRERFATICEKTAEAIHHRYYRSPHKRTPEDVMDRCLEAAKELRGKP